MRFTAVTLLPGTIIHELSHWLTAELLGVPTGEITLIPRFEEGLELKMGSVAIAKKDPFRRTLIGLAPLFTGLTLISVAAYFLPFPVWSNFNLFPHSLLVIAIFLVSNTMFSSKKDLEVAVPFFLFLLLAGAAWWYFSLPFPKEITAFLANLSQKLLPALTVTLGINLIFLLFVKLLTFYFERVLKRKVIVSS